MYSISWLLINSTCEEAAIYGKNMSGYKTAFVRREKDGGTRDFIQFSKAVHGSSEEKLFPTGRVKQAAVKICGEDPGGYGIDTDSLLSPFHRERFCESTYCRFT